MAISAIGAVVSWGATALATEVIGAGIVANVVGMVVGGVVKNALFSSGGGAANGGGGGATPIQPSAVQSEVARGALVNGTSTIEPIPVIYGSRRIGGTRVFVESSGSGNTYLNLVIALAEGEVSAINTVYIDDIASTDAKFSGLVSIEKYVGTAAQGASAALIAQCANWTTAHKLSGVAYVYVRLTYNADVFHGMPTITCDVDGRTLYDPRTGLTAFSHNPALAIRDYLTNALYGRGLPSSAIDDASFITAANICDEVVSTPGGNQARYTCDGIVDTSVAPLDNINALLSSCRGMLIFTGGKYRLRIDAAEVAGFAFDESNIVGNWSVKLPEKRNRANRIRATFFNPANNWQPDITVAESSVYRADDNGVLLEQQLTLGYTSNAYRAAQIAQMALKQSRKQTVVQFTSTIAALRCEVGQVVTLSHSTPGWSGKEFRIIRIALRSNDEIDVTALEYDAGVYSLDNVNAVSSVPSSNLPDPTVVAVPTSFAGVSSGEWLDYGDGTLTPRIKLTWTPSVDAFVVGYQVEYKPVGGTWQRAPDATAGPLWISSLAGGVTYDLRIRATNSQGYVSAWATAIQVVAVGATDIPATVSGFSATFAYPDVFLSWTANAAKNVADYSVRIGATWATATQTNIVRATSLNVSPSGNGTATYWIAARTRNGVEGTPTSTTVTISQLGAPTGFRIDAGVESIFWQCDAPTAPEFLGIRAYCSSTNGFTPGAGSLVYDGPNTNGIITRLQDGTPLQASGTYYVRVDAYNVYGKTGTTAAAQLSATCRANPGSGSDTLAAINTILGSTTSTTQLTLTPGNFAIQATDGSKYPFAVVDTGGGVYKTLLNSDVLIGGNLTIDNLTTGALPSNVVMSLGAGMVQLDGAGQIRVYANTGANADYVRLTAGNLDFRMWIAALSQYVDYNYMSRVEYGSATNGATVNIPGYWKTQPRVMVSPASIGLYKTAYSGQDQTLNCSVANLVLQSGETMKWQFDPTATLTLAANTGQTAINAASGSITGNWTSGSYTTAANCSSILARVSALSVRGNGASQYFYRQYRWRIEYYSGGAWVTTDAFTAQVAIGAQTASAVASNKSITFPSAAAWQWRVYMEFSDVSTAVFGAVSYTYTQETRGAGATPSATITLSDNNNTTAQSATIGPITTLAKTGSAEIYQIVYTCTYAPVAWDYPLNDSLHKFYYHKGSYTTVNGGDQCIINWAQTVSPDVGVTWETNQPSFGYSRCTWAPKTITKTVTGSNLTYNTSYFSGAVFCDSDIGIGTTSFVYMQLTISNPSATIYYRTPVANSTTAANSATLINNDFTLTSAQVLATGTLNWIAVGS